MVRTRAPAFSIKEEQLLIELIKKRKNIIENKKTDQATNEQKSIAWKAIEEEFNADDAYVYRNYNILRCKYENLKKRTRKKLAELKSYSFGNEVADLKDLDLTPLEREIGELIVTQILGLPSEYESDTYTGTIKVSPPFLPFSSLFGTQSQTDSQSVEIVEPISPPPVLVIEPDPVAVIPNPNTITPSNTSGGKWKTWKSGALRTRQAKRATMANNFSRLAEARYRNVECERQHQQETHDLKMAQMKELHEQEMKFRLEKHQMELKILSQQFRHAEDIHKHDMVNDYK